MTDRHYYVEIKPCRECEKGIVVGPLYKLCKTCSEVGYVTTQAVPESLENLA